MNNTVLSSPVEAKTVCILAKDSASLRDIDKQLEYFGYKVSCCTDVESLNRAVAAHSAKMVIVYSDLSDEEVSQLRKIKREHKDSALMPQLIVISLRNDFKARLAAVRLGAQGYFPIQVDVIQIIDKMEYLVEKFNRPRTFNVLLVEDDEMHVRFYTHVLQAAGIMTTVIAEPHEALDIITNQSIDLVLMDYIMPDCNGQELATIIRQHEKYVSLPIIFLSARDDLESRLINTGLGIDEFLVKPVTGEQLVAVVRNRAKRAAELQVLMARDSFTGLLNHDHFMDMLDVEMSQTKRFKINTAYAAIDIDNFREINDLYGHFTGDQVIKRLSRLLQQRLRRSDLIGRCGGEEFSIIMPDCTIENASNVIESMRSQFADISFKLDQQNVKATFSAGLTSIGHFENADELIKATDEALKKAKDQGRNRLVVA